MFAIIASSFFLFILFIYLFVPVFYLGNVLKYTEQNRMTVQNLALVLGPNLIWMENDPLGYDIQDEKLQ